MSTLLLDKSKKVPEKKNASRGMNMLTPNSYRSLFEITTRKPYNDFTRETEQNKKQTFISDSQNKALHY